MLNHRLRNVDCGYVWEKLFGDGNHPARATGEVEVIFGALFLDTRKQVTNVRCNQFLPEEPVDSTLEAVVIVLGRIRVAECISVRIHERESEKKALRSRCRAMPVFIFLMGNLSLLPYCSTQRSEIRSQRALKGFIGICVFVCIA